MDAARSALGGARVAVNAHCDRRPSECATRLTRATSPSLYDGAACGAHALTSVAPNVCKRRRSAHDAEGAQRGEEGGGAPQWAAWPASGTICSCAPGMWARRASCSSRVHSVPHQTGALTFREVLRDGVDGVDGLDRALQVVVSHDGRCVYVAGNGRRALTGRDSGRVAGRHRDPGGDARAGAAGGVAGAVVGGLICDAIRRLRRQDLRVSAIVITRFGIVISRFGS